MSSTCTESTRSSLGRTDNGSTATRCSCDAQHDDLYYKPLNILHLTLSLAPGGRREVIVNLAAALERMGERCRIAVLGDDPGPDGEGPSAVDCLNRRSLADRRALRRLADLCRRERIDVIHAHDAASQFWAALVRLRHPRIAPAALMTFHRSLDIESATWRDRLRNQIACALTGAVATVSQERRRQFVSTNHVRTGKVVCIPNGIDVDRFRPRPDVRAEVRRELGVADESLVCGAVGHFGREKGLDIVLRGFQRLRLSTGLSNLRLIIAGDGTAQQRTALEQLAASCAGRVTFLGQRTDLARWYQSFDLLLHAPRQEAFGLVAVEAMATGLPVVATRVGGLPEIIRDGETGRLVEADSPAALADAARELVESPSLRRQWGERGRETARNQFSVELQARR